MKYSVRQCYYGILFRAVQIGFRDWRGKKSNCKAVDEVEKMADVTTGLAYLHMNGTKEYDAVRQDKTLQWHQFVF